MPSPSGEGVTSVTEEVVLSVTEEVFPLTHSFTYAILIQRIATGNPSARTALPDSPTTARYRVRIIIWR